MSPPLFCIQKNRICRGAKRAYRYEGEIPKEGILRRKEVCMRYKLKRINRLHSRFIGSNIAVEQLTADIRDVLLFPQISALHIPPTKQAPTLSACYFVTPSSSANAASTAIVICQY